MLIDACPVREDHVFAVCSFEENWRIKSIPSYEFNKKSKQWDIPIIPVNIDYLRQNFTKGEFTPAAINRLRGAASQKPASAEFAGKYPGNPMAHQQQACRLAHNKPAFFFAHAMGAGKTYTMLTLAADLFTRGVIDGMLVICPATIRSDVWLPETAKWLEPLGVSYAPLVVDPKMTDSRLRTWKQDVAQGRFGVMICSVQSMSNATQRSFKIAQEFLRNKRVVMAVDESSRIKNHDTKRTENIIELGQDAKIRWCATGTKITQGIHDLYAQFRFLDWRIIGQKSFYTFRNRYCQMGGFEGKQIIAYNRVDELMGLIKDNIHVVRKQDANDLPPKTYQVRTIEAAAEQKKMYLQLKNKLETEYEGEPLNVQNTLDRMVRYQQIAGGNFPYVADRVKVVDKEGKAKIKKIWKTTPIANPKLVELLEIIDGTDDSTIIWCVFTAEIQAIYKALESAYPGRVATYYGQTENRSESVTGFQSGKYRFMIANQKTASMGLTLTKATLVIYFSNSFSYEDRIQSEDRAHRTGQVNSVHYVDILSDLPIDKDIRQTLDKKQNMATFVSDRLRSS
jgi:SNF2 family DNA or RNA helicase